MVVITLQPQSSKTFSTRNKNDNHIISDSMIKALSILEPDKEFSRARERKHGGVVQWNNTSAESGHGIYCFKRLEFDLKFYLTYVFVNIIVCWVCGLISFFCKPVHS